MVEDSNNDKFGFYSSLCIRGFVPYFGQLNFLLFTFYFLLFTFYFLLFTFYFLLFTFYFLLFTFYLSPKGFGEFLQRLEWIAKKKNKLVIYIDQTPSG